MDKDHHEDLPWFEHVVHIRDLYQKRELEYEKMSSEYAKLVFSSLMILNGGGLGSIPAISIFFNMKFVENSDKIALIIYPFAAFIAGSFLALLGAFAAYVNYQCLVAHTDAISKQEFSIRSQIHPASNYSKEYVEFNAQCLEDSKRQADISWKNVRRYFYGAVFCGFSSLGAFALGCILLARSGGSF